MQCEKQDVERTSLYVVALYVNIRFEGLLRDTIHKIIRNLLKFSNKQSHSCTYFNLTQYKAYMNQVNTNVIIY